MTWICTKAPCTLNCCYIVKQLRHRWPCYLPQLSIILRKEISSVAIHDLTHTGKAFNGRGLVHHLCCLSQFHASDHLTHVVSMDPNQISVAYLIGKIVHVECITTIVAVSVAERCGICTRN